MSAGATGPGEAGWGEDAADPATGRTSSIEHTKGTDTLSTWAYAYSKAGRVMSEDTTGRSRSYTYDAVGRLTVADEGGVTRRYAWDANSNRCANASSCTTPDFTYDDADRVLSSPAWSSYSYDSRGNMTSATPRTAAGPVPTNDAFSYDAAAPTAPRTYEMKVGQADLAPSPVSTATSTGSLGAAPASTSVTAAGPRTTDTELKGALSWARDLHYTTQQTAVGTVSPSQPLVGTFTSDGTGNITVATTVGAIAKPLSASGTDIGVRDADRRCVVQRSSSVPAQTSCVPEASLRHPVLTHGGGRERSGRLNTRTGRTSTGRENGDGGSR
jgi:YD repeat-containing protein